MRLGANSARRNRTRYANYSDKTDMDKTSKIGTAITGPAASGDFLTLIREDERRTVVGRDYPYYLPFHDRMVSLAHGCINAGLTVYMTEPDRRMHRRPTECYFHVSDGRNVVCICAEDSISAIVSVTLCLRPSRRHGSGIRLRTFSHGRYGEYIDECSPEDIIELLNRPRPYGPEFHYRDADAWEADQAILGPWYVKFQADHGKRRQKAWNEAKRDKYMRN